MDEKERINIIRILEDSIKAIKENNIIALKDLSNQSVHDTTIIQDEHTISLAVIIYSLSKFYERKLHYETMKGGDKFYNDCLKSLENAKDMIQRNDLIDFENEIKNYLKMLSKTEGKLNMYIKDVIEKAKINKASRLYEHGLSVGRTADILGISSYELMEYIGKTYIADVKENKTLNVKKRLETARRIFS